jgi:hypothetical protein
MTFLLITGGNISHVGLNDQLETIWRENGHEVFSFMVLPQKLIGWAKKTCLLEHSRVRGVPGTKQYYWSLRRDVWCLIRAACYYVVSSSQTTQAQLNFMKAGPFEKLMLPHISKYFFAVYGTGKFIIPFLISHFYGTVRFITVLKNTNLLYARPFEPRLVWHIQFH